MFHLRIVTDMIDYLDSLRLFETLSGTGHRSIKLPVFEGGLSIESKYTPIRRNVSNNYSTYYNEGA